MKLRHLLAHRILKVSRMTMFAVVMLELVIKLGICWFDMVFAVTIAHTETHSLDVDAGGIVVDSVRIGRNFSLFIIQCKRTRKYSSCHGHLTFHIRGLLPSVNALTGRSPQPDIRSFVA